jgi:hypothetical protein
LRSITVEPGISPFLDTLICRARIDQQGAFRQFGGGLFRLDSDQLVAWPAPEARQR